MLSFGRPTTLSIAQKTAIANATQWVTDHCLAKNAFIKKEDIQVVVTEVQCNDPGCVPIETFVAVVLVNEKLKEVIAPERFTDKILKPVEIVSKDDVHDLGIAFRFTDERFATAMSLIEQALAIDTEDASSTVELRMLRSFLEARMQTTSEKRNEKIVAQTVRPSITRVPMKSTQIAPNSSTTGVISPPPLDPPTNSPNIPTTISSDMPPTIPQQRDKREILATRKRNEERSSIPARHNKEEKRRGCPCCDPDNLDHMLDKIMFMEYPPA